MVDISAFSRQRSAVSGQHSVTQIKLLLTYCLDAIASGGNPLWPTASLIQKLFGVAYPMSISTSSRVAQASSLCHPLADS
ncbi:hypothetical protein [Moorena sp. SIO3A5]|uniref:hypothetical protein n=1 Tax=Moorena sp. SIO3A5 TaxID=2607822 RepID=UPI0013B8B75D|nr:hypothetical protein [Moorena sp. SIO3A5]NEQ09042.1 hypothetical protein [Moorena sp. SIO4E2]